jgi:DNA-binding CsgD family transcriptional regulator
MFVSEHTVQDYLKSSFTKTSVRSRGARLSRVLGT